MEKKEKKKYFNKKKMLVPPPLPSPALPSPPLYLETNNHLLPLPFSPLYSPFPEHGMICTLFFFYFFFFIFVSVCEKKKFWYFVRERET